MAEQSKPPKIDSAPRWALWVALGVLFVVILPLVAAVIRPFTESKPKLPILGRGTGLHHTLHPNQTIVFAVEPTGRCEKCWTDWQVRPNGVRAFWITPQEVLDMQNHYDDGSTEELLNYDPLTERVAPRKITGVRFRNPGSSAVPVKIDVY